MSEKKREPQFKAEYQVGDETLLSITVSHPKYITIDYMIQAILMLANDVKNEIDDNTAGRVALAALKLIFKLAHNSDTEIHGQGDILREKLDAKSKHKVNRSERVDLLLYGFGGKDKGYNKVISRMIEIIKKKSNIRIKRKNKKGKKHNPK
jgi:hypothetical protein